MEGVRYRTRDKDIQMKRIMAEESETQCIYVWN